MHSLPEFRYTRLSTPYERAMTDELAPGFAIEETSARRNAIEAVSTITTGFVGPTRFGPIESQPGPLTSLAEFEAIYGDGLPLDYEGSSMPNYLWHAARAFFENGGTRLYIARVFRPLIGTSPPLDSSSATQTVPGLYDDGHARSIIGSVEQPDRSFTLRARFPGAAGNLRVRLTIQRGPNLLGGTSNAPTLKSLAPHDIVWIGGTQGLTPPSSQPGAFYLADFDTTQQNWRFTTGDTNPNSDMWLQHHDPHRSLNPELGTQVRVLNLTIAVTDHHSHTSVWKRLALDPRHHRRGMFNSISVLHTVDVHEAHKYPPPPLVITPGHPHITGLDLLAALTAHKPMLVSSLKKRKSTVASRSVDLELQGGNDGQRPTAEDYRGAQNEEKHTATALQSFEVIKDIAVVAAPGSTAGMERTYRDNALAVSNALIAHVEHMQYRFAVLDSGDGQTLTQVRTLRAQLTSNYAALYYPWVRALDPLSGSELLLPPSGFVAGIYARTDSEHGVSKAPANQVVIGAVRLETQLTQQEQELLNPEGINCLRFFEGRGFRLWGARTISTDRDWKYVNIRRYMIYLEHSIRRGTEWAAFEPNGDILWATIRRMVEEFLVTEWRNGGLLGTTPNQAFFVRCDRSTMTQEDLDKGRMVCLIGVAPIKPAEFVLFRIGQWTADHTP